MRLERTSFRHHRAERYSLRSQRRRTAAPRVELTVRGRAVPVLLMIWRVEAPATAQLAR